MTDGTVTSGAAAWESRVEQLWEDESLTDDDRIAAFRAVEADAPHPALWLFELASAHDAAGREVEADVLYEQAVGSGLAAIDADRDAHRQIQHASTLRNLGRFDEAITMLQSARDHHEVGTAREAFLALSLFSAGREAESLRVAIEALIPTMPLYRRALGEYAALLTEPEAAAPRPEI